MHKAFPLSGCIACFCFWTTSIGYAQMIVAHRGASYDAPENTCAAFEEAWLQKADGVEADFHLTSDQQIVCIHDKDTQRTAGQKLTVAGSRLEELKRLEYGAWKNAKFKGEPLPTFAEVAQCIPPDKKFIIELKTGPEIVPLLVTELAKTQLKPEQMLIIAFNSDTVAKCKELLPEIRVHWLVGYKQDKVTGAWTPTLETVTQTLSTCGADDLGTQGERAVVTPEFIAELKRRGLREFHVWTIDDPDQARYFQKLGAIGITTNRPAFIREAIR